MSSSSALAEFNQGRRAKSRSSMTKDTRMPILRFLSENRDINTMVHGSETLKLLLHFLLMIQDAQFLGL